jgi:hypothetical protein
LKPPERYCVVNSKGTLFDPHPILEAVPLPIRVPSSLISPVSLPRHPFVEKEAENLPLVERQWKKSRASACPASDPPVVRQSSVDSLAKVNQFLTRPAGRPHPPAMFPTLLRKVASLPSEPDHFAPSVSGPQMTRSGPKAI